MAAQSSSSGGGEVGPCSGTVSMRSLIALLVLSNLLALQLGSILRVGTSMVPDDEGGASSGGLKGAAATTREASAPAVVFSDGSDLKVRSGLELPQGNAVALPSVRVEETKAVDRKFYGGKGDKQHLGGFTEIDLHGVSPAVWKDMTQYFGIKSILDVGCGRGISTSWFVLHGIDTLCVEGSHDAVERTIIPDPGKVVTEHDFSRGPWWPPRTVDAVWSVEFLEHVGRNFHQNYMPAFRKAALLFVTSSRWGGWHHVEIHPDEWWQAKMETYGFVYSEHLTKRVRDVARREQGQRIPAPVSTATDEYYNAQHVYMSMKVFINPAVASLPQHQHLFAEHGCYSGRDKDAPPPGIISRPCGTGRGGKGETAMPPEYQPLKLGNKMDWEWGELIKKTVKTDKPPVGGTGGNAGVSVTGAGGTAVEASRNENGQVAISTKRRRSKGGKRRGAPAN